MKKILTKNEELLMNLLWNTDSALSINDFQEEFAKQGLSKPTVFKAVQSLTGSQYLEVVGFEKATKTYARTFRPAITREEYAAVVLKEQGITMDGIADVVMALINDAGKDYTKKDREKTISDLEMIIITLTEKTIE